MHRQRLLSPLGKEKSGQLEQIVDPKELENFPGGQALQVSASKSFLNPLLQMHDVTPSMIALEKLLSAHPQSSILSLPISLLGVKVGQSIQVVAAAADTYDPGWHREQRCEPITPLYDPCSHDLQDGGIVVASS